MPNSELQKPIWAWCVLVGGGLFLLNAFPGIILTLLIPFWKRDEVNLLSIFYMLIALSILIGVVWGMKRAFYVVKTYTQLKRSIKETNVLQLVIDVTSKTTKKPIWPWFVIGLGALLLIGVGPGAIMLPIMPLFLAGMSTDSGDTPGYVPFLIITIGYGIMIGYIVLLVKAIKTLRKNKQDM